MTDNDTNPIGLSRRRVLGGIGAIGVASAGAGLGTTAFFSDSENFEGNTLTAGQFELHVGQTTHFIDQDGIGPDEQNFMAALDAAMDGDQTIEVLDGFFDITDAKPGDSYKYCWDICVKHNPGFVEITLETVEDLSGADNPDFDDSHVDGGATGTLGEHVLAVVTLDDQQSGDDVDIVFEGTLGELMDAFENGGLVHAWESEEVVDDGEVIEEGVTKYCHLPCETDVEGAMVALDNVEVCVYLYIPSHADVGGMVQVGPSEFEIEAADSPVNLLQGASFTSNVAFAAEQCRHNESPFDGKYTVSDNSPPPGMIPVEESPEDMA